MSDLLPDTVIQQILEQVTKESQKITSISPPQKELAQSYEETIEAFERMRSMPLFYPYLGNGIGNGALVKLGDGSVKYDCINGIGVHFGHSHPSIIKASLKAAVEDIAMQGHLQQNHCSFALTSLLLEQAEMDHVILCSSGAMANENALKLILQKKFPAQRILAFERCFMGRTLALAQITDKAAFREGLPQILHVDYVPFYDWRDPIKSTKRAIKELKKLLVRYPGQYACMCFEMIQGEGGFYPGKHEFFIALINLLKEHHIAVFVDEIQTFGRTDQLFAHHSFGLKGHADVVTVGKLMHTCATLFTASFRPKPGLIAQTYTAATSSIYVAHAILDSLINENYLGRGGKNLKIRKYLVNHLQKIAEKYPGHFEGPFGHGLMIAATPFKGERKKVIAYAKALFNAGIILFIAGNNPTRIRLLPPAGAITYEDLDQIARILEEVFVKCLNP